jgi:hypothetical protein
MTNEYIAGFFDGEGSITLTKNGQAKIAIVQKDDAVLRLIQAKFGGRVVKRLPSKIGGVAYALILSKKEVMLNFLRSIQPYCLIKKVDLAIQFIELTQSNENRIRGERGYYLSSGTLNQRLLLRDSFYT